MNCISELGIERTSITVIAKRAEVSRGLVAHYFPKKEDLFFHVVEYLLAEFGRQYAQREWASIAPSERITHDLRANLDFFIDRPAFFHCFFLFYFYASIEARYRALNTRVVDASLVRYAEHIRERHRAQKRRTGMARARALARLMQRELIGSLHQYYTLDHGIPAARFKQHTVRLCVAVIDRV